MRITLLVAIIGSIPPTTSAAQVRQLPDLHAPRPDTVNAARRYEGPAFDTDSAWKGALIGFAVGAPLGGVVGMAITEPCPDPVQLLKPLCGPRGGLVGGFLLGGALGGSVGFLIGRVRGVERRRKEGSPDQLTIGFVSRRDGRFELGASVRF